MNKVTSINTFNATYGFIELHRTFYELSQHCSESDDLDISRALHSGERLRWPSLIKEYRLIILSEAGSGKTFEIRHVACKLREEGKPAFFLRLEHIPRDFEDAFEVGTYETFREWLASGEEGWLFLDSVDEARLRDPRDFKLAIRKLSRQISTAKDRAHIVITGRTIAWRPKTDLAYCAAQLPYAAAATSKRDPQDDDDAHDGSFQTETETQGESKSVFKIVALDDLTSDQILVFAEARRIKDSRAFLEAVERADAWSFTSRPQDLEELTEFWIDKGQIGTRLELMRNSIDRRLAERDQSRADARPLSAERARLGARLLAAATTLVQDSAIRVPDGVDNSKGIAVQSVLPDWDDKDQATLLLRPIFDEAIYGAVRFHHRSVREYLTAEWFAELLNRETSRRTTERLFFRNQYGLEIVVPTLRPILPWLAILDEKIRERIREVAPEIFFEGGDPGQLPLEIRRHILHEVCKQMTDDAAGRSMRDYAAVQRFANLDLTDDVRALMQHYANNEDLTAFLLRMVWLGQLAGARPEALDVALSPSAEQYARIAAFRAIKAIGSDEDQEHVRRSFLTEATELKREWLAELLDNVQPTGQTLDWLLACLEKSEPNKRYTVDPLSDAATKFACAADIVLLPQFVVGLNELLSLPPMLERRNCEVSERFLWLMTPACKVVERLILARHPASLDPDALAVLHKFSAARDYDRHDLTDVKVDFSKLVPGWTDLNRALFWFGVERSREAMDKSGERLTNYWRASLSGPFWRFDEGDFEYVAGEISRQTLLDNRLVALSLAFDLYRSAERPRAWRERLKKIVTGNDALSERLGTYLRPPAQSQNERRWKRQEAKWKRRDQARRKKQDEYHADWKKWLHENLDEICAAQRDKPGAIPNALCDLFDQIRDENRITQRWTEYNWRTLIPEYGEEVARLYRDGTVSFWRHHEPKLRSEGAPLNQTTFAVNRAGTGVYSPGLRDSAQDARNSLFELLNQIPGKESFLALMDIARTHLEEASRPWILLRAKTKAEQSGDIEPWSPVQVRDFHDRLDRTPSNHRELAELAILRLLDLKDDLEHGDSSVAGILQTVTQETEMRKFIGRELREKASGRYSIPQEEEFADAKKPDLRFHGADFDGPVPAELKLADNWTGPALFERLENQLCGDYLRDSRSRRGIFVLVYRGDKGSWRVPFSSKLVGFAGLIPALQEHWRQVSPNFPNVDDVSVIGIDVTKRST